MKRNLLLIVFIHFILVLQASPLTGVGGHFSDFKAPGPDAFVTTWKTTTAQQSIMIPVRPDIDTYSYDVDWGDGTVSLNQTSNAIHIYATVGVHTISITGTFPAIQFGSDASGADNDTLLLTVQQWGTQQWDGMVLAFKGCINLTTVPSANAPIFLPNSTLYAMFYGCRSFNADLTAWDLSSVRETADMFNGAIKFNGNISGWNVSNVTNMQNMFNFAKAFNGDISGWDVANVLYMNAMFSSAESFNGNISSWNVLNVEDMASMFSSAKSFNQDISAWDVSKVSNMNHMFYNAPVFNQDISRWIVSGVTDMSSMFSNAMAFNGDISGWNVSGVQNFNSMFAYATSFNTDLSGWDVTNATDMSYMFINATAFNQDIGGWNVGSVTSMETMFYGAQTFNQNISTWDVSHVTNMKAMFDGAVVFNQNLGPWKINAVTDMTFMLDHSGLSITNYEATLASWATKSVQSNVALGADGLKYCEASAHQSLITGHGWIITGDRQTCLVPAHPDGAGIVYVDSANAAPGDGSSWSNSLKYLSNATVSAVTNTAIKEIHIAKGTYYPTGAQNNPYRDSSFVISRSGLKLLGGFPTGGGVRDYKGNPTLLSGDLSLPNDTVDNSFHVMVITNVPAGNDSLIVDGITFTKGNASNPNSTTVIGLFIGQYIGGGMVISQVSDNTIIRNCTIKDNYAIYGGGMIVAGGIDFDNQQFLQATPRISNCLFEHNVSSNATDGASALGVFGGALVNLMASPIISNCSFVKNEGLMGAAISNSYYSSPVIIGTSFRENKASGASVIFNIEGSSTMLANCTITNNISTGMVLIPGDGDADAVDLNEILGNAVIANIASSSMRIINSTIARNYSTVSPAVSGGNILNMDDSKLFITNSVIWDNQSMKIVDSSGSTTQVAYSLVQGLPADPLDHNLDGTIDYNIFVDAPNGDYQLNMASPVINAGLNDTLVNALMAYNGGDPDGGVDLAGNPRILESVVDLGAFEFVRSALPVKMGELKGSINKDGHAILQWPTYTEVNNKGFQVQESSDGVKFVNGVFVPSLGQNGNSSAPLLYSFDAGAISGVRYFRLQQMNYNGTSTGSNVIRLQEANTSFHLTAYPNPARNNINVHVEGKMAAHPRIIVVDFSGRVLISRELAGSDAKIDLSSITAGIYLIKYVDDNQSTVIRIVKH